MPNCGQLGGFRLSCRAHIAPPAPSASVRRGITTAASLSYLRKCEVCFAITVQPRPASEAPWPGRRLFRQIAQNIVARPPVPGRSAWHGCGFRLRGARGHDLLHHRDKPLLLGLAETFQRLMMRCTCRGLDLPQETHTGFGQPAHLCPAIPAMHGSFDKFPGLQALKCAGGRGAIKHDFRRQSGLIGGSTPGQRGQEAVLQRR